MNRKLKIFLMCFLFILPAVHPSAQVKKSEDARLFIQTLPEGARIRILSIKPRFVQGILLKPGPYHIEVSADGYETRNTWITIEPGQDMNLGISLKKFSPPLPGNPDELVLLAIDYQKRKEHQQAIEVYRQAIRMDFVSPYWWTDRFLPK